MTEALTELAFLSIFHILGGAALGITLRGWADNPSMENLFGRIFFLIWGSMFGCMPLVFGLQQGLLMLGAQLAVLVLAIAGSFLWLHNLRELVSNQSVVMIGFGGIFLMAGLVAVGVTVGAGEWLPAVLFAIFFVALGGGIFLSGLRRLISGSPDE